MTATVLPAPSFRRQQLSASKLALAAECPGAFALPAYETSPGEAAERGTAIHAFVDRAFKGGDRDAALASVPFEWRETCRRIDLDALASFVGDTEGHVETELAIAYDVEAHLGRVLDTSDRKYDVRPTEIPGTVDAVALPAPISAGSTLFRFVDWKTGFRPAAPEDSWQIKLYALALASAFGADQVEGMVGRLDEDGEPWFQRATWDVLDLAVLAQDVKAIARRVWAAIAAFDGGAMPEIKAGPHCRWCEAFPSCPAQAGAAQALVAFSERTADLTPERAGSAWALLRTVQDACSKVEAVLREMAARAPLPLPDGKELRPLSIVKEAINPRVALLVLRDMDKAVAFVASAKVSKAALEKVLGEDVAAEALGRIRDRGGMNTYVETQMRAMKPKRGGNA